MLHWSHQFINLMSVRLLLLDKEGSQVQEKIMWVISALQWFCTFILLCFKSTSPCISCITTVTVIQCGQWIIRHIMLMHFFQYSSWNGRKVIALICHICILFSSPVNQKFREDIQIFRDIAKSQSLAVKLIVLVTVINFFFLWPFRSTRLFISTGFFL